MKQYIIRNVNDVFAIPGDLPDRFIVDLKAQCKNYHENREEITRDSNMLFIPDGRHNNILGV